MMGHGGRRPRAGRKKGASNKLTALAREGIERAADALGGAERLAKWAKEDPVNERAFWTTIYTKLLPLQVTGEGGGPVEHNHSMSMILAEIDGKTRGLPTPQASTEPKPDYPQKPGADAMERGEWLVDHL